MRGIQINNYFNNHITLNGKKIQQEPQTVALTNRQKLNQPPPTHADDPNSPDFKPSLSKQHPPPLKKRTNTLVELKKHPPLKRSLSVERQRNAASAKKREELVSDSQEKEDELLVDMSQKKLKQSATKGGLGKRSKSTIIKAHEPLQKELPKKQSKKMNSNPTESSKPLKSKRKKQSKISQTAREHQQTITTKHSTAKKEVPVSKQVFKKEKMVLKLDRNVMKSDKTEKKSARNHPKPTNTLSKNSKPVSAREKKVNKNRFIEQLKEKYENQTILEGRVDSSRSRNEQNMDHQFLSVMSSLQKILNSVGSKQKLKKQLQMINQKLREFKLQTQQDEDQQHIQQTVSNKKSSKMQEMMMVSLEKELIQREEAKQEYSQGQQYEQEEEEYPLAHKMSQDEDDMFMRLEGEQVKNPLLGKRNNIFFIQEKPEDQTSERRNEIESLKQFKNLSTKMMEKAGLAAIVNTQKIEIEEALAPSLERKLTLQSISLMSNGSNKWEDKYPSGLPARSPKFDQSQLLGAIELKEQFLSSKRDKMSELVRKMFQKQLVSPRSYEFQLKSLDKRYQQENQQLESMRRQAEQLSSMLSQIRKDKEEIQDIDELIRNQKWEEAQKLVQQAEHSLTQQDKPLTIIKEHEQAEKQQPSLEKQHQESHTKKEERAKWELSAWQKEGGWERVRIGKEIEGNEFVQPGQLTNRGRRLAQAHLDINEECGGTEESEQLQPHQVRSDHLDEGEYIYYQEENEEEKKELDSGLIRLVQIPEQSAQESTGGGVFHIRQEEGVSSSMLSAPSLPQRGGFVTNLYFIKEYCIAICEFVRDNDTFKAQFRLNVSKPLQFDLPALLTLFRQEESAYPYSKRTHRPAIPSVIWDQFNAQYETLKFHSSSSSKDSDKYKLQKELEVTFVRMIYEVLNESLDHQRPGGQFGKALPWRETAKHLKNLKQLGNEVEDVQAYDLMFGVAIARIIQWGSCLCGFLPDTVELQNTQIDQAYVNHIRETRTAFLLEKMMAEQEVVMTNFELQQAEMQYRLGQMVIEVLINEALADLGQLF